MNKSSTDRDWEAWGKENPYYGVLTDAKFLNANLTSAVMDEFFSSGEQYSANLWQYIRTRIRGDFAPRRVLDYGCGAGRLVIPFARRARDVVGIDVSRSVLEEARKNCSRFELDRVKLLHLNQIASLQPESFDLVHSVMVFQHIPVRRGEILLQKILDLLAEGGIGVLHFTFSIPRSPALRVITALRSHSRIFNGMLNLARGRPFSRPHMQMNNYSTNRILELLAREECSNICVEFTGDSACRGAILIFEKCSSRSGLWDDRAIG